MRKIKETLVFILCGILFSGITLGLLALASAFGGTGLGLYILYGLGPIVGLFLTFYIALGAERVIRWTQRLRKLVLEDRARKKKEGQRWNAMYAKYKDTPYEISETMKAYDVLVEAVDKFEEEVVNSKLGHNELQIRATAVREDLAFYIEELDHLRSDK